MSATVELIQKISDSKQKLANIEKVRTKCINNIIKLEKALADAESIEKNQEFDAYALKDVTYDIYKDTHMECKLGNTYTCRFGNQEVTARYTFDKFTVRCCVPRKFNVLIDFTKIINWVIVQFGTLTDFYISVISGLDVDRDMFLPVKVLVVHTDNIKYGKNVHLFHIGKQTATNRYIGRFPCNSIIDTIYLTESERDKIAEKGITYPRIKNYYQIGSN